MIFPNHSLVELSPLFAPFICLNIVFCFAEIRLGDKFRLYMRDMIVLRCADVLLEGDLLSFEETLQQRRGGVKPRWIWLSGIFWRFKFSSINPILDSPYFHRIRPRASSQAPHHQSSSNVLAEVNEQVLHYSRMESDLSWPTNKLLWIMADTEERCHSITRNMSDVLDSALHCLALEVDVSKTHSVFWPLVCALTRALPTFREEIGKHPPWWFAENLGQRLWDVPPSSPTSPYNSLDKQHNLTEIIRALISGPLAKRVNHIDNQPGPSRLVLVVRGIRTQAQANEMYAIIEELTSKGDPPKDIGFVVISAPVLFQALKDADGELMKRVCTLRASDTGTFYSGRVPTLPKFYETLFKLLVEGIHRVGGPEAERFWRKLPDFSISPSHDAHSIAEDDPNHSTLSYFSMLYTASETRKKIMEGLSEVKVVPRLRIMTALVEDNIKVGKILQLLSNRPSYKKDVPNLPKEYALAALNLIHYILDSGFPENDAIGNYDDFARQAHLLLNRLAKFLNLLPEEIEINNVVLIGGHPIKHGGFSNIYQGMYTNPNGERIEVALKVLKIFEDQSDETRHRLDEKFAKEALLWSYLKHKNIVPFLGVDFTTFPAPARALVSPWFPLGNVLKYMKENSPSSPYAPDLISDVIHGLKYLHPMNIVHGDLCGRNILINNEGRACLTDFGLASFVEWDTSIKSSTRGGSTRWMAPELLLPSPNTVSKGTPPSDVWAFGCVCCEIWSEGVPPFSHLGTDAGVIFAFAGDTDEIPATPYTDIPHDNAGNLIPEPLWVVAHRCWKRNPAERPEIRLLCELIAEMIGPPLGNGFTDTEELGSVSHTQTSSSRLLNNAPLDEGVASQPQANKGKKRVAFQPKTTVRFGPLDVDAGAIDLEETFKSILEMLYNVVEREVLVEPLAVEAHGPTHLALYFRTGLEANNFAMTWMVHRFEPFSRVSAVLVV
ncbi:hypothetical protein B0H13DRAFT_246390 [Mycena leptocephala]|nr:hypothetical protein B0H13DRAFT_246390 [Mycena leptocephala]